MDYQKYLQGGVTATANAIGGGSSDVADSRPFTDYEKSVLVASKESLEEGPTKQDPQQDVAWLHTVPTDTGAFTGGSEAASRAALGGIGTSSIGTSAGSFASMAPEVASVAAAHSSSSSSSSSSFGGRFDSDSTLPGVDALSSEEEASSTDLAAEQASTSFLSGTSKLLLAVATGLMLPASMAFASRMVRQPEEQMIPIEQVYEQL
jgi:hypothetical protein